jgi:hypothetical protein
MKYSMRSVKMRSGYLVKIIFFISIIAVVFSINLLFAADDPSIKGELRLDIHKSMNTFIETHTVDENFYLYDAVNGRLLRLKFDKLHEGIVKKDDFYVSCADFIDPRNNKKVDVDFLVIDDKGALKTLEAVLHKYGTNKYKYHLEK